MLFHNSVSRIHLLFFATCLTAARMPAAEYANDVWFPQSLRIMVKTQGVPTGGLFVYASVSSGTNEFAFIMPADFRLGNSTSQQISLVGIDNNCSLTLRILGPASTTRNLGVDFYRGILLTRYPGAVIGDAFFRSAANSTGSAFDIYWRNADGVQLSARVAFIPSPALKILPAGKTILTPG
jgi:hypothetical protein